PYSSLRADPLGVKALYESIDPLLPARRNLQTLSKLGDGRETTLLWLGEDARKLRFSEDDFDHLETFVRTGGRLVLAALPIPKKPLRSGFVPPARGKRAIVGAPTNAPSMGDELDPRTISIKDRWDLSLDYADLPGATDRSSHTARTPALASLRPADP